MQLTKDLVASKISEYLRHEIPMSSLVDWAESAMMEAEFEDGSFEIIREVVARLGVADVRTFGLTWDDCEEMLNRLGYSVHLEIVAV
jgi:hypothetical protein